MAKSDNGSIGNVIRGFRKHCYGIFADKDSIKNIDFFYINESIENPGYLLRLRFGENKFYEYLLKFSIFLVQNYQNIDPCNVYNTFLDLLRTYLESNNIFTTTSLQLKKFEGYNCELISKEPIEIIQNFKKEDFYKHYLNAPKSIKIKNDTNYLYIMLNKETGYFKIGRSKNPEYRERTLHSKEPSVSLLKVWECEKQIERKLQKRFIDKKVRGEWFKLNMEDLTKLDKIIKELKSTDANN
ncbi:MAG: GIY-YIG nuclease family protein [Bacteroidales bacterium]|nr:GIY-YIG nuclease family protein [Bacteroidales bacterium]